MDFLKKYGFQITMGIIVILLLINIVNLNTSYTQFKALNTYSKISKANMNVQKNELKTAENELKELKEQKKTLEKEYDEAIALTQKNEKEKQSFSVTKQKLLQEKDQLLLKNDAYYTYDFSNELTEDEMYEAVKIATNTPLEKKDFTFKVDEDDSELGVVFNAKQNYILFAYDRFTIVYEVNAKEEIQKISIVDVEEKKVKAKESYKNLPIS